MINRIGDRPIDRDPSAVAPSVEDDDAPSSPWTRVLGILVLGSFAAAAKTARAPRRPPAAGQDADRRSQAAA
jgi:hypothetical protein